MKKRLKDVWKPMLIVAFLFILGSFLPNGKQNFNFIWQQSA